jgi:hypothetical protein
MQIFSINFEPLKKDAIERSRRNGSLANFVGSDEYPSVYPAQYSKSNT